MKIQAGEHVVDFEMVGLEGRGQWPQVGNGGVGGGCKARIVPSVDLTTIVYIWDGYKRNDVDTIIQTTKGLTKCGHCSIILELWETTPRYEQ